MRKFAKELKDLKKNFGVMTFVDDMIGFIAQGSTIHKTIDGGQHWVALDYPAGVNEPVTFEDISFVNKDDGYVAFSGCSWADEEGCPGGWMLTKNGGASWHRIDSLVSVNAITFTSPFTGYVNTSQRIDDFWSVSIDYWVLKTVNGGTKWSHVGGFGDANLRFSTDDFGCAYESHSINLTTNGGKTWTPYYTDNYLTSIALVSDDAICASFAPNTSSTAVPSSMVRSEDGVTWTPVRDFPYTILSQGFSPDGNLGVAVGISGNSLDEFPSQSLTVSISTDRGKTWVDLDEHPEGYVWAISVPSANAAYILCSDKLIKCTL